MYNEETCHLVALSKISGVGALTMKTLIGYCGTARDVFLSSKKSLIAIPGINTKLVDKIKSAVPNSLYDDEIDFAIKNDINIFSYLDKRYPERLKHLLDSPALLYFKGNMDLNKERIISIVGTRKASQHALNLTESLIKELQEFDVAIISGLAYGIDIAAHRASLKYGLDTLAVVAHGLDRVYPSIHRPTLTKMLDQGGVISEFSRGVIPQKERFPMRNRIVAGLCDALLIIESGKSGGSMITTQYANDYNRDVFAIPGRVGDPLAAGTNYMIKSNIASLVESASDIVKMMNWDLPSNHQGIQRSLFNDFNPDELSIWNEFEFNDEITRDYLIHKLGKTPAQLASSLLSLEFKGVLKPLPGNRYVRV